MTRDAGAIAVTGGGSGCSRGTGEISSSLNAAAFWECLCKWLGHALDGYSVLVGTGIGLLILLGLWVCVSVCGFLMRRASKVEYLPNHLLYRPWKTAGFKAWNRET